MADIDNLSIRISADATKAIRNINSLASSLDKLNSSLGQINPSGLNNVVTATSNLGNAMSNASASVNNVASSLSNISKQSGNMAQVGNSAQNLSNDVKSAASAVKNQSVNTQELASSTSKASSSIGTLKAGFAGFLGVLKSTGSLFGDVSKKALSAASHIHLFGNSAKSSKKNLSFLAKELTRIGKMLKLMITRMVLRKVIQGVIDGFKNLAQYSKTFDASISLLWNSFRQLGNSIAAAVSPLLNAFAPAINYIIQLVIKAVNAINQLISSLMGMTTWTRAKTLTDSYADSLDKTNKSAKALKKTLLGFDELNQLQDNSSSGGGGTSPADMFEEVPIESKWKKWADELKKMWDAADFTKLGHDLGKALKDALDSINWDKIKEGARQVGKSLATLMNGFEEVEGLGYSIGKTVAEGLNTVFEALDAFVTNKHWASTGHFIADTLNGWFENIDWELIQHTFEEGFRGLGIAIAQFVMDFHWDNLSTAFGNLVNTLTGAIKALFTTKLYDERGFQLNYSPFYKIGYELAYQIVRSIEQIDWKQFGQALGSVIQGLVDVIKGAVEGLKAKGWKPVKKALEDAFAGMSETLDFGDAAQIILQVFVAALGLKLAKAGLAKLGGKIVTSIFGGAGAAGAAGAAGEAASAASAAGASIGASILAGIASAFAGQQIGTELGKMIFPDDTELYDQYKGINGFFQEIKDLGTSTVDFLKMTFNGELNSAEFWDGLTAEEQKLYSVLKVHYGQELPQHIQQTIDKYGNVNDALQSLKKEAQKISDDTQKKLDEMRKKADDSAKSIGKIFDTTAAENMKKMREQSDSLKESLNHIADTKAAEGLKRMRESANFGEVKKDAQEFETTVTNTSKSVSTATSEIEQNWTSTQTSVSNAVETMSVDVSSGMTDIQTIVTKSTDEIMKSLNSIKDGMTKDKWTFDGVAEGLKETFRKAKEGIKSEWNQIANTLNGNHEVGTSNIKINLPKFANGGFPENGLFMANSTEMVGKFSNGRNAVANNEQITDGIARAVFNAMTTAQSSGGGQYINNTIMVDGVAIARAVTKGQEQLNRRYSPTMA